MPEQFELTAVDLGILAAYIVGILALGFRVGRKKEDVEGYFLGGLVLLTAVMVALFA
jgi:solute:Na+ symporter, SSS family